METLIHRETSYKIHQWLLRTLSEKDKNRIKEKYPSALKRSIFGIEIDAKIKHIMDVIGDAD